MNKLFFLLTFGFIHLLLAVEPPRLNKDFGDRDIWISAYSCNTSKFQSYLQQRKPFSTDMLIQNKLIESYALYRCGNLKERDRLLEEIDELIESQYLKVGGRLDYDIKKRRGPCGCFRGVKTGLKGKIGMWVA